MNITSPSVPSTPQLNTLNPDRPVGASEGVVGAAVDPVMQPV